jgi:hypothetical protein
MNSRYNKILPCFVLFIHISLYTDAQNTEFIAGLLVNINGISFVGKTAQFWNASDGTIWGGLGGSVGVSVQRDLTKKLYPKFELRYSKKGSIYEYLNQYSTQSNEVLFMNYIDIPVLIGYKFRANKKQYFLESGVSFAKQISSNIEFDELNSRTGTPNAENFKNIDISWTGCLKFVLNKKGNENLLFGLRIDHSLIPIHHYYKIYHFDYGIEINYLLK